MLVLITKASDDYWYKFKEINTIEDLLKIDNRLIIQRNLYNKRDVKYWDGFAKEDIENLKKAKIEVIIYDDYVE
jgi:hypothetical protein